MGLDMYLERMPIYCAEVNGKMEPLTPLHYNAIDSWISYQDYLKKPLYDDKTEKCKWEDWTQLSNKLPSQRSLKDLQKYITTQYYFWDTEHKYPRTSIIEEVGYWRKANEIHNWFVEHIQNGEDDCSYHRAITPTELIELKTTCQKVLDSLNMKKGKVANGYTIDKNGEPIYNYEDGMVATTTDFAEVLLPTCSGCFFGSTDYDQYYVSDLKNTIDIINNVLNTTDFNTQQIYYCSSW